MIIEGANLGKKEVQYRKLSQWQFFKNAKRQEMVERIEKLYFDCLEESKRTKIAPFPQKNGKADILPGMINHRCSNSLEALNSISQHGILASEWFGQIESEGEGVFCSFIDRIHSEENFNDREKDRAKTLNSQRLKAGRNNLILFLDGTNPVMKKLLHLDFFEYAKVRTINPSALRDIYTDEEIELFERLIYPVSSGKNYHIENILPYCDWSAIPGGIPATLVNGICTKLRDYDEEYIKKVSKLFPDATIFDGNLEIIHTPQREKNEQDTKELEI